MQSLELTQMQTTTFFNLIEIISVIPVGYTLRIESDGEDHKILFLETKNISPNLAPA